MSDVDMETVSWIISSDYRLKTCRVLADSMATPTGIAESVEIEPSHASRSLSELRDRDIVELQVPESQRKGRIYALTDSGEEAFNRAEEIKR
jgi:DNA-binding MarR family transcriptional regulator